MRQSAGKAPVPFNAKPKKPERQPNVQAGKGGGWVGLDREGFSAWLRKREAERLEDGTAQVYAKKMEIE